MKLPCLFALVIFVAFQEVIPVPVPEADAKDPTIEAADEIVNKVEDALSTGDGRKALLDILEKRKNKKDESKDINGKNDESIQLDKKSAENEKEEELRSMIVENVKDALEEGKGRVALQQLLEGNKADSTDETAGLGNKVGIPAAIEDELGLAADTIIPNPQADISDDVPMLQTGESPYSYFVNDEGNFNDPASDLPLRDETEIGNDYQGISNGAPINKIASLDVAGMLASNDEGTDNKGNKDALNPGFFVSQPFTTGGSAGTGNNNHNNNNNNNNNNNGDETQADTISQDNSVTDNKDALNPGYFVSQPFTTGGSSGTSNNNNKKNNNNGDETQADNVDNGYFVSEPFTTNEDSTQKDDKPVNSDSNVVLPDLTESPVAPKPVATGSGDASAASNTAPAGSDTKVKDTINTKDRQEKGIIVQHDNDKRNWKK